MPPIESGPATAHAATTPAYRQAGRGLRPLNSPKDKEKTKNDPVDYENIEIVFLDEGEEEFDSQPTGDSSGNKTDEENIKIITRPNLYIVFKGESGSPNNCWCRK